MSSSSSSSSLRSLDVSVSSSNHSNSTPAGRTPLPPHLNAQLNLSASAPLDTPMDFYIIRVTVEPEGPETEGECECDGATPSRAEYRPEAEWTCPK